MKQNIYDDSDFFAKYSAMPRSMGGLDDAGEWPVFQTLLPNLQDKRLLDLGCGFGWHCRYASQQNAQSVVGVDLSEKMIAHAKELTNDSKIEYQRSAIEDIDFAANAFDVVISSLALHYVERFDLICQKVHQCLIPGGPFIMSVEHPIFTAVASQDWYYGVDGERLHWPVDNYQHEGCRHTQWMADDVMKYHRTVATYVNTLIGSGFQILKLAEPGPTPDMLIKNSSCVDECRRPMFLLIAAARL
jgi:SAM-dependent methyltransferase